jgi:elongator complex protein 3
MKKEIIQRIIQKTPDNPKALEKIKREFSVTTKKNLFSNIDLLKFYHELTDSQKKELFKNAKKKFTNQEENKIIRTLITRPVRSLSGIVNISVLTKPYPCPGKCTYCPQEKGTPKSYLKSEPAVMRAIANNYDPYKQVKSRIESLEITGHLTDKIELRIVGATWSYYPKKYQEWFISECFRACNDFKKNNLKNKKKLSFEKEQKKNEKSKHRIVGLSIETRPDFINGKEILHLRRLNVTSIELGVQTIYDDILNKTKRGHKVESTIQATRKLKDAGFKICYQIMPNLPGSNFQKDLNVFKELFSNQDFKPDYLKIYPLSVLKGTEVYNLWKNKKYKPYKDEELKKLLKEIKKEVPLYVRIQRLIRDIPAQDIEAGTKTSNLRQIIQTESIKEGWSCKCVRCREIKQDYNLKEKLNLFRDNYDASQGKEIFLSFEDKERKNLYSLLRARIPSKNQDIFKKLPILRDSLIIREIHTYGQQTPLKQKGKSAQHKGLGKKLMKEIEKIAKKEFKVKKIVVISSVGTRNYYRKQGYRLKDTYMIKNI